MLSSHTEFRSSVCSVVCNTRSRNSSTQCSIQHDVLQQYEWTDLYTQPYLNTIERQRNDIWREKNSNTEYFRYEYTCLVAHWCRMIGWEIHTRWRPPIQVVTWMDEKGIKKTSYLATYYNVGIMYIIFFFNFFTTFEYAACLLYAREISIASGSLIVGGYLILFAVFWFVNKCAMINKTNS